MRYCILCIVGSLIVILSCEKAQTKTKFNETASKGKVVMPKQILSSKDSLVYTSIFKSGSSLKIIDKSREI